MAAAPVFALDARPQREVPDVQVEDVIVTCSAYAARIVLVGALEGDVPHVGRDVAEPEANPASERTVRLRAMQDQRAVQRELPGAERRVHGRRVVHALVDGLSRVIHAVRDDPSSESTQPGPVGFPACCASSIQLRASGRQVGTGRTSRPAMGQGK
jgi:hypothetical protein